MGIRPGDLDQLNSLYGDETEGKENRVLRGVCVHHRAV